MKRNSELRSYLGKLEGIILGNYLFNVCFVFHERQLALIIFQSIRGAILKKRKRKKECYGIYVGRVRKIFRAMRLFYMIPQWWLHVITHLSNTTECITTRVNPNLNYGLRVIIMCQCRSVSCNKCTILVPDVDSYGIDGTFHNHLNYLQNLLNNYFVN